MLRTLGLFIFLIDCKNIQSTEPIFSAWNFLESQKKYSEPLPSNIQQKKNHLASFIIQMAEENLRSPEPLANLTSENLQKIQFTIRRLYGIFPLSEYPYGSHHPQDQHLRLHCEKDPVFLTKVTVYLKFFPPFDAINDIPESEKTAFLATAWDTFLNLHPFMECITSNE